ncbi:HalOD1 output domain-containing protein [Haloarcula amylolytica]|uniref:Halobacterial output domain-containing protein n=1 Tax=Haloarcula amylolytica JCM 13557 TaxID=1227452 RepID=M0K473_9EURY|nr:HalOD1 output domain-containing protein [Haloarcula amylolytica]EMA14655.1 hypothetical protein C442_19921 [Haloarcula amylolytica JCM 13557]
MSADMSEIIIGEIIEAVSEVEKTNSESMDMCLHRDVSTEAIQRLVAHESDAWRLQFETENHVVEVTGNDTILIDGEQM